MGLLDALDSVRKVLRLPPRSRARQAPPPRQLPTVAAVVAALRTIDTELDHHDGVWQFNRMYLQVTELVDERIREGYFANAAFMERLDIVFAHLYLDTVQADAEGRHIAECWEPVFDQRDQPLVPIQFAVAGMNAHINHDLGVAVVATCQQLGLSPSSPGVHADYVKVTGLLAEVHEQVRQRFLNGVVLSVDRELSPLLTLMGSWSIARAREAAWTNSEVLWELRDSPVLRDSFQLSLCRAVGLAGRTLLVRVAAPI
ncbi:hypothetical protein FNH13_10575 [Ornithinimicrobium ciconiae]|uniref:Uncharacterized protein n=2 Tax=Ornithinimicrobium ciconiae TaxID=2594265 RepID=A0A516GFP8_9MICO|nr:hypothetical protein FNH13_10575 [Ornithinimicrobium ciconiae]